MRQILSDVIANERLRSRLGDELLAGNTEYQEIYYSQQKGGLE